MTEPAAVLFWDTSHVGDEGVTAEMVTFPGAASASILLTRPLAVPEPVYFEANIETVRQVDYPDNNKNWPIMSERMRALLLPDAPAHRVIPVSFIDDTVPSDERFDGNVPRPGVTVDGFAAIQFLERTDAMDMERSEFTPDADFPGRASSVKRLVLKDMPLPSIFRLSAYPGRVLISCAARERLEKAGIKGVQYWDLAKIF